MEKKIRVGIINYLNTRPLLYGLRLPPINEKIELTEAVPAELAEMLIAGKIDIGLVPVAITQTMPQYYVNGNYCIGAIGDVASVCVFSQVPLNAVEKIYMDYQSRSSVALCQWLIKNYWKVSPEIVQAMDESYLNEIEGTSAGLVIGDRALQQRPKFRYIYDLAGEWKAATGLPFVFAAWISSRKLPESFVTDFDEANGYGLQHLKEVIKEIPSGIYDLEKYYSQNLSYVLDDDKKKGMDLFLTEVGFREQKNNQVLRS